VSSPSRARYILAIPVVVAFFWLLSNNTLDVMLLYMMVMPGGLLQQLAHAIAQEDKARVAPATHRFRVPEFQPV
jgi:hypothetical protein